MCHNIAVGEFKKGFLVSKWVKRALVFAAGLAIGLEIGDVRGYREGQQDALRTVMEIFKKKGLLSDEEVPRSA